jgi:hypothetical protein
VTASADEARRFSAFGLRLEAPEGMLLCSVTPKPLELVVGFERSDKPGGRARDHAGVQRLGMAASWHTDLKSTLREREPAVRWSTFEGVDYRGHEALLANGHETGKPFARLLGRGARVAALAWHCHGENAVYVVSSRARRGVPLSPRAFRVECQEGSGAS